MPLVTTVRADRAETLDIPFLAVVVPEGAQPASLAALDQAAGGGIARAYASGDFRGKRDETILLYPASGAARLLLIGIGAGKGDASALRRAAAIAGKRAVQARVAEAAILVTPEARGELSPAHAVRMVAEGAPFGAWRYLELKRPSDDTQTSLTGISILAETNAEAKRSHDVGAAIAQGQAYARSIQVLPGNTCTPTFLGEAARELAKRYGMGITVLDKAAVQKEGMDALMAVAQGSAQEPRFIAIEYQGSDDPPVVLVGKGVTFDTGGISIKPAMSMEEMKFDMSGAAAVLGTFDMLGRVKPRVHVVGLIPSAENMPSGTAYRPGDVVGSHFGKTIEVINTDAEGRLLLADALSYARRYKPAAVVDAATLTGAVVTALGHSAIGLMGNDDALMEELRAAGERAGERAWPLPLWDDYRDLIKSDIADVKNSGGRPAGSITAGWFLKEFVEGYRWAHLDIAGTAYSDRDDATRVKGPTGMAVRLFSEFVLGRAH
ncbi:MAG TPA: leucyl aminopeptidase [Gemmatimonadales bacterium]|nr:leucyl aminopeptidase [Gemmatimonadales bacterium]